MTSYDLKEKLCFSSSVFTVMNDQKPGFLQGE